MLQPMYVTGDNVALLTDLYELTMAAGYWSKHLNQDSTFELYFRRLPVRRSYVLAAGLEQALHYICNLKFSGEQIDWLRSMDTFKNVESGFFEYLRNFRFTGDVWAMEEGTPVFPLEPMLQIQAPLIEAQILETFLLTTLNMQSMIATKASRIVWAAAGRGVVDFGSRRAHGPQAALLAARAAYLGGCIGTSNVLAGNLAGIPLYGTAAHSFVMAFPDELAAFQAYQSVFPEKSILLIDTYDTLAAARKVKLAGNVQGVRIDSGDLREMAKQVRAILDSDGLTSVKIFASGDLNEYKIAHLLSKGAPIDYFGVGTELTTSYDDPALSGVYKLVEATIRGKRVARSKVSSGKVSYPGKKQVYRFQQASRNSHDQISLFQEPAPSGGRPLLKCYVRNGVLVESMPDLNQIRRNATAQLDALPPNLRQISKVEDYPVILSDELKLQLHHYGLSEKEVQA